MSLVRIALRTAAVEALRGRTLVGDNVLDSPNGALDIQADGSLRMDEERPFVSVFTDEGTAEGMAGRSLVENGRVVLVIESGISMAMTETNDEDGTSSIKLVGIEIPASDTGFEFHLDIVQRQITDALTDPDNAWADIYRGLHHRVAKVEVGARRNTDDGQRLAGRQTRITMDLMPDPVRGQEIAPDAPFARFLTALAASGRPDHAEQHAMMAGLLGSAEPDWKQFQRRQGYTADELRALGRGPIAGDVERATPVFAKAEIDAAGSGTVEVS